MAKVEKVVQFPKKLLPLLFGKAPYKVAHGGRGSAKSWSFARSLLMHGVNRSIRVLCCREVQKSIEASVHQLLSDQIEVLGLQSKYNVGAQEITSKVNDTKFIFVGLSDLTADSIKSYEGVDICWVEEGQTITDRSWKILIPTIRKEGSETWISFNPVLESDPTYQRFVKNPPPGAIVVEMNWRDNPFWNKKLDADRRHDKATLPKAEYDNIWEGKCLPAVEGAIYFDEVSMLEQDGRLCKVPYDPMLKVHVVIDLGFNDDMAIGLVQKHASSIRIIKYIAGSGKTLAYYSGELKQLRYNWGKVWLPFSDGFSGDAKSGMGADQIMRAFSWNVARKEEVADLSVEEGIRLTRLAFPRFYVDDKCVDLVECWKRYRRNINKKTATAGAPVHDDYSHGADMTRYIAINERNMTNEDDRRPMPNVSSYSPLDMAVGL